MNRRLLNHYEMTSRIGAGGMGEVFRARDTRLNRDVAIKVLPKDFASDPDRLRRFEQEAKTLASLNHPNILTIHDTGLSDGAPYLVSELLEGCTLRDELTGGALPIRKAIDYAFQIAQGLAAAHARGIIHRDLKPENVFITKDARVKILDFGLAKIHPLVGADVRRLTSDAEGKSEPPHVGSYKADAPTLIQSTVPGLILGTVGYMSPEQVRGEPADHRSDIFSFGSVLYEMLSSKSPFQKTTAAETMASILKEEPSELTEFLPNASAVLEQITRRCLAKSPDRRFQSSSDLAFALESLSNASTGSARMPAPERRSWFGLREALITAALVLLTLVAFKARRARASGDAVSTATAWRGERLDGPSIAFTPRVSPDGKELAFTTMVDGQSQLGLMFLETGDWKVLTTNRARGLLSEISWSRDGARIYFSRASAHLMGVFSIPRYGGEEHIVLDEATCPRVLPDDSIVLGRREYASGAQLSRLYHFFPQSEELRPLNGAALMGMVSPLSVSPDGKTAFFRGRTTNDLTRAAGFWRIDLITGRTSPLLTNLNELFVFRDNYPFTVSRDGSQFIFDHPFGNLHRLFAADLTSPENIRPLLPLTSYPTTVEVDQEGTLFVDQIERPGEILRRSSTGSIERLPLTAAPTWDDRGVLPLPNNRFLTASAYRNLNRLTICEPGQETRPFLEPKIESGPPLARLGPARVLFSIREGEHLVLASASLEGRGITKIPAVRWTIAEIDSIIMLSVAASPDGQTIYYSTGGNIYSLAIASDKPQKLCPGNSVAIDPGGRYLIVKVNAVPTQYLVRFSLQDHTEQRLSLPADYRLTSPALASNAIARDGRIAVLVAPLNSWYWHAAVLDPKTGQLELINDPLADMYTPGWDDDGRLVTSAMFFRSSIWRFHREVPVTASIPASESK